MKREHLDTQIELGGQDNDKLLLRYPALMQGTAYVAPVVTLEFDGRATGEPHQIHDVVCDIVEHIPDTVFPIASARVMNVSRTFWEKATATHVYCAPGRIRGERYARHWHDLAAIALSPYFATAIADRDVAIAVARHKSYFFIEKDVSGQVIDYAAAAAANLKIVPTVEAKVALEQDYGTMLADEMMIGNPVPFDELLKTCAERIDGKSVHR